MNLPVLEVECWKCYGAGAAKSNELGVAMQCDVCGGVGWLPTEEGRRLLEFLERHLVIDFGDHEED